MDTTTTVERSHEKASSRAVWARLTPFSRHYLRAEYKHLIKANVHPIIARGSINRTAGQFLLVRAGV